MEFCHLNTCNMITAHRTKLAELDLLVRPSRVAKFE